MAIVEFKGKYRFLSNFYIHPVIYQGEEYQTIEHGYQSAKTINGNERLAVQLAPSATAAKRLGRVVTLRVDWEEIKLGVMEELLRLKFEDPELRAKLKATAPQELIEGNWWGDRYYGATWKPNPDNNLAPGLWIGENHLGKLLMKLRSEV